MNRYIYFLIAVLVGALLQPKASAQTSQVNKAFDTPEGLITAIYDAVTFPAGRTPDWEYVRSMFIEEAIVVLRTSPDGSTVFSVDGFVQDFVTFIEEGNVTETGFTEDVIKMNTMTFGDIAHVLVLFESSIPGKRPPTPGVDSFQLIRRDGRWWIASVTNERPAEGRPIPDELQ